MDGLAVSEIKGVGGYKAVLGKLREAFEPYVETALPRALYRGSVVWSAPGPQGNHGRVHHPL